MTGTRSENEELVETKVTYHIEVDGSLLVRENVPARVHTETGERLFSPQTVERLQESAREKSRPSRIIETPVYHYA